ncbi:MAG: helix-turn-helix transcriptional regulator [Treponema sp.]|nr:helix-turn-helix transcriptional regulator [Treponema sp.]
MDHSLWGTLRKQNQLTREEVVDQSNGLISVKRLEHIEKGDTEPTPYDVVLLSQIYDKPELCFNYCSQLCSIGKAITPIYEFELTSTKDLPIITLELLDTLNSLSSKKDRIISIAADGEVSDAEKKDFKDFVTGLEKMELAIKSLKMWAQKNISD